MDSTKRFSDRVENYVRYRPSYPEELIHYLGIDEMSVVCDAGAGTGILSELLIDQVKGLYAIEPNEEMRSYAESRLSAFPNYHSLHTTAEATGLEDASVDIITAAQAFHWFDREACRQEFRRILKPGGRVFLIWNDRQHSTDFLKAYEALLQQDGTDYTSINHQNITEEELKTFFSSGYLHRSFHNQQDFDLEGFLGRVFSSSYTPAPGDTRFKPFRTRLIELFERYQQDDMVSFIYRCEVYSGYME